MTPLPYGLPRLLALDLVHALTPRQREVAERLAMGEARSVIARELGISVKTLDIHVKEVKKKWKCAVHGIGRIWFCACQDEGQP